jgi:hypothetical protein
VIGLLARLFRSTPTHRCVYSDGDNYPEHCAVCGRSILDDPEYRKNQYKHLRENVERANQGLPPLWFIDRRAM